MILVIDGYNLIKQALNLKFIAPEIKFKFLQRLNNYAQKKQLKIYIIFDGYDENDNFSSKNIKVMYSGYRESADQMIANFIPKLSGQVLLISSDRQLCNELVEEYNLEYMDSLEFYGFLKRSEIITENHVSNDTIKLTDNANFELDNLMMQDLGIQIKTEIDEDLVVSKENKLSKDEKRVLNKIKKL